MSVQLFLVAIVGILVGAVFTARYGHQGLLRYIDET